MRRVTPGHWEYVTATRLLDVGYELPTRWPPNKLPLQFRGDSDFKSAREGVFQVFCDFDFGCDFGLLCLWPPTSGFYWRCNGQAASLFFPPIYIFSSN